MVLVSHSFGDFIITTYFQMYKNDKIVGIVSIGGIPIRPYPRVKQILQMNEMFGGENMWQSIDIVYDNTLKMVPNTDIFETQLTRERLYSFFMMFHKEEPIKDMF